MNTRKSKINKKLEDNDIIKCLLDDPTKTLREMAKELKGHSQTLWRKKKKLEEKKIIWGYTTVIDEIKFNREIYLILMKMKYMTKELLDKIMKRTSENELAKHNVRLIDILHVTGEFDWVIKFSTLDRKTAGKYYDTLRIEYEDFLLEKPVIVDINFIIIAEGKKNPELKELYEFVP